jgi:uncharacterized membrane protein YbhN (UPF0104 family)
VLVKGTDEKAPFNASMQAEWANVGFSMLTPSQSGGGPAQMYMLVRGGMSLVTSMTLGAIAFVSTTVVLVLMGLYSEYIGDATKILPSMYAATVPVEEGVEPKDKALAAYRAFIEVAESDTYRFKARSGKQDGAIAYTSEWRAIEGAPNAQIGLVANALWDDKARTYAIEIATRVKRREADGEPWSFPRGVRTSSNAADRALIPAEDALYRDFLVLIGHATLTPHVEQTAIERTTPWVMRAIYFLMGSIAVGVLTPFIPKGIFIGLSWIWMLLLKTRGRAHAVPGPWMSKWTDAIYEFRGQILAFIKRGKLVFIGAMGCAFGFLSSRFVLAFLVMRFLGVTEGTWSDVLDVQLLLMFLVYFFPSPGGAGFAEWLSSLLMEPVVTDKYVGFLPLYNVLWRITSLYIAAAIGLFCVARGIAIDGQKAAAKAIGALKNRRDAKAQAQSHDGEVSEVTTAPPSA